MPQIDIDRDTLLQLAEVLKRESGISLQGLREDLVRARLNRRLTSLGITTLRDYVTRLERDRKELPLFVNLMTTNHTYFFRETPHLEFIENTFLERFFAGGPRPLSIWCAACSTGEEPYTLAMLVHRFLQQRRLTATVRISGTDINTEALRTAQNGVYPANRLSNVPREIRMAYFRQGRIPHDKFYRVNDSIRELVKFSPLNLISPVQMFRRFDLVMCRNVLIYFEPQTVRQVVRFLCDSVATDGAFITGLSEQVERYDPRLCSIGRSIYVFDEASTYRDRPLSYTGTKVVGTVAPANAPRLSASTRRTTPAPADREPAAAAARSRRPSTTARTQPSETSPSTVPPASTRPTPSRRTRADIALSPSTSRTRGAEIAASRAALIDATPVIAIGASTGGIEALQAVVPSFETDGPAILIAQHIPPKYSTNLADALALATSLPVREARGGEPVLPGHVYVSPGGRHLTVRRRDDQLVCVVRDTPVRRFRPSVDLLFESLARLEKIRVIAAILTGMGDDGTKGALALREHGHYVIGQDEASSLVYGMPAAAAAAGALDVQLPLRSIGSALVRRAGRPGGPKAA